jgi:hypothetical protein
MLFHVTAHCTKQQRSGFAGVLKELPSALCLSDPKAASAHNSECNKVAAGLEEPVAGG